jgi:hypothetical protein
MLFAVDMPSVAVVPLGLPAVKFCIKQGIFLMYPHLLFLILSGMARISALLPTTTPKQRSKRLVRKRRRRSVQRRRRSRTTNAATTLVPTRKLPSHAVAADFRFPRWLHLAILIQLTGLVLALFIVNRASEVPNSQSCHLLTQQSGSSASSPKRSRTLATIHSIESVGKPHLQPYLSALSDIDLIDALWRATK